MERSDGFVDAVARAGASVVRVEGRHRRPSSGVVWASDRVVTSAHGLDGDTARVGTADGAQEARVLAVDEGLDLALLEVTGLAPAERAPVVPATGAWVLTLGRPGARVRASLGIVGDAAGPWRTPRGAKVDAWIDVDGSLPRGFSGGALVDPDGRLIGVNTHGVVRGGTTLPAATVDRFVAQAASGRAGRGWLGVAVWPVRLAGASAAAAGQAGGLVLLSVEGGGPADQAGLLVGDVLLGLDGEAVAQPQELVAWLADGRAGQAVTARIARAGEVRDVAVSVGRR